MEGEGLGYIFAAAFGGTTLVEFVLGMREGLGVFALGHCVLGSCFGVGFDCECEWGLHN